MAKGLNRVLDDQGRELGYWFYDQLMHAYVAVRHFDDTRASVPNMTTAERWIREIEIAACDRPSGQGEHDKGA